MLLAEQFRTRVTEAFASGGATVDLLPMVFVRAAVAVLPIDGAGLSMTNQLRVPLAATDENVVLAERLQTTVGEGPCLAAVAMGRPLVADLATMAASWPTFHDRFAVECPYRSIASFPLRATPDTHVGALDLYSTGPGLLTDRELDEVDTAIATPIATMLFQDAAVEEPGGGTVPGWLGQESVNQRMNVWVAVGMSMERLKLHNLDALALLRGYAYSHGLTLDEVAFQVTDQGLQPDELLTR